MDEHISCKIDAELAEKLEEEIEAGPYDPTQSEVVRAALEQYLDGKCERQPARLRERA